MHQLTPDSLVLYKIRPARVLAIADKIEIELEDGKTKRVRGKDVKLLHPGPLQSLRDLVPLSGDLDETWELLAGSETNLPELAELIYGRYAPDTAWAAWQLVADGLLFEGTPERITARTSEQVSLDRDEREAKAAAEQEWLSFLERLNERRIIPQDRERLAEVERLAHKQSKVSRILKLLGYQEKPENAHRLLLELGYWEPTFNPHPGRIGVQLETPGLGVPSLPEEKRLDLTHLPAFAIDDEGNRDPDDAIGSVANYLARHGWKKDQPVLKPIALLKPVTFNAHLKPYVKLKDLATYGRWKGRYQDDTLVTLVEYQQPKSKETLMGFQNFYVITRYNRSRLYARAVYELSRALAKSKAFKS